MFFHLGTSSAIVTGQSAPTIICSSSAGSAADHQHAAATQQEDANALSPNEIIVDKSPGELQIILLA